MLIDNGGCMNNNNTSSKEWVVADKLVRTYTMKQLLKQAAMNVAHTCNTTTNDILRTKHVDSMHSIASMLIRL